MAIKAPSIESIMENWERDSKIDQTDPGTEMIRIPVLHNKYNKFLTLHNLASKRAGLELQKLKKLKWAYYTGKMDQDELQKHGWEPFPFVLKTDIQTYLDGDIDITNLQRKKVYHEEAASFCLNVMKEIHSRTFQIKAYMEWERFINGQH